MIPRTLAQLRNPVLPPTLGGGTSPSVDAGTHAIGILIGNLIGGMFIFGFILAFFSLLAGGIKWITAGSDKGNLEAARNKIIHALVGLLVVGAAWATMRLVGTFLGINFPNLTLPTIK